MAPMIGRLLKLYVAGPSHPGKVRLVHWLGRHVLPARGVAGTVYPGRRLWLRPNDWVDFLMLRDGSYEPLTLDFLRANLYPGDRAILAGVNNGLHAIVAAGAVGAAGRILACDPQPAALLRAHANAELNGLPEGVLVLVAAALGSAPALAPMSWPPPDNPGAASLLTPGDGFIAPVYTLAHLAASLGVDRPRLLLLDIQGYEEQALAGLGDLRPEIAVVEDDPEYGSQVGVSRATLCDHLVRLGYQVHDLHGRPVSGAAGADLPERNLVGVLPGAAVRWAALLAAAAGSAPSRRRPGARTPTASRQAPPRRRSAAMLGASAPAATRGKRARAGWG
jgi:FkbM family methyltransferase